MLRVFDEVLAMNKPKMILFDYGETLVHEESFSAVRGNAALLRHTAVNKHGYTAEDVWYVGDRYEFDAIGALSVGMVPVLYTGARAGAAEGHTDILTVDNWGSLVDCISAL